MRIALIQLIVGDNRDENLARGVAAIHRAADSGARLVLFPELSFTPFYPQYPASDGYASLAEAMQGSTVATISQASKSCGLISVINLFEKEDNRTFDTSVVIGADGSVLGKSRMLHITEYDQFHEQGYYTPGDTFAPVFETPIGRIGVCICYDRHFPEYMRSLALQGADLVVIPQAGTFGEWPGDMYTAEIRVASFQNGFFCAMANRVGVEGAMEFAGESVVTDPFGDIVTQAASREEEILIAEVDIGQCGRSPARNLFLKHRRPDIYSGGSVAIAQLP